MSIQHCILAAIIYLLLLAKIGAVQYDDDFDFVGIENVEVGFEEKDAQSETSDKVVTANVGRVFHLDLANRKEFAGKRNKGFEVRFNH